MFQACVYGLNNSIFFNEETIDSLKEYLFSIETIIDTMDLNNLHLEEDIKKLIKGRKNKVSLMMSKNDSILIQNPIMDDSLKHLDRIVEILRAKKKYIFIEK